MPKVLVIEDEDSLRDSMTKALRFEGFDAVGEADGRSGVERALAENPDVIITDILMPGLDGIAVVSLLKSRPATRLTPIIMVTALSQRSDQRRLMELGADDYIVKPFTLDELIGATKAQLRKGHWLRDSESIGKRKAPRVYRFSRRSYDPERRILRVPGRRGHLLSVNEARLLECMLLRPDKGLKRNELFSALGRPASSPFDRTIDVLVSQLRQKVEENPRVPVIIRTIRSVGYMLSGPVREEGG